MGKYRYFKVGERVQINTGFHVDHEYIIEVQPAFFPENFEKIVKEFNKPITSVEEADEFISFLNEKNYVLYADYMEYANVMI